MKALFTLRGPSSRGKSTTLLSLIEKMENDSRFRKITQETHPNGTDLFYIAATDKENVAMFTAGAHSNFGNIPLPADAASFVKTLHKKNLLQ